MPAPMSAPALAAVLGDGWRRPGGPASALAAPLRRLVVDGRVPARTRIPSERDLCAALAVSRGSVSRAFDRLREDGYLVSARGAGSWLTLPAGGGPAAPPPVLGHDAGGDLDLTIAALPAPDALLAGAAQRAAVA